MDEQTLTSPTPTPSPTPPTAGPSQIENEESKLGEKSEGGSGITTNVSETNAKDLTVIGQLNVTLKEYLPNNGGQRVFSIDQTWIVTRDRSAQTKELFVGDTALVERMLRELKTHRIVLIAGSRGTGKTTTALYLSACISEQNSLPNATLVIDPLDRQLHVDVRKVAGARDPFGGRVLIFNDAFARDNTQLLQFFTKTDRVGWDELATLLRANDAYLVFTADTSRSDIREHLSDHLAPIELAPLEQALVLKGLERKVAWLTAKEMASPDHVRIATEQKETIVRELRTLPRVSMFLDQFVLGEPDLAVALKRFHDLRLWFSTTLAPDVDAWCFVLTLTLAQTANGADDVGWYEFNRLRRAITDHIKADQELFPRRRHFDRNEESTSDEKGVAQSLSDDKLLAHCRAEIVKESGRLGDLIRFVDPTYAEQLWQIILTHNRRVLMSILPVIRGIAENETGPGSYPVRVLAAQILGRAGELDPMSVSIPIVQEHWVSPENRRQRPLVGKLFQGMRASTNENYRRAAIAAIDSLMVAQQENASDRLLTAISAYAQAGVREPALAMDRLGAIAVGQLAPVMENMQQISRLVRRVDRHLSRTSSAQVAEDLIIHRYRLGRLAHEISKPHAATLLGLEHAVVYLCVMNDPVQILRGMRDWISKGGTSAGTLVALLFLHGGIAEELERLASDVQTVTGNGVPSPILLSLSASDDAVSSFASFLTDVYDSIHSTFALPVDLQRDFKEAFNECLTGWARATTVYTRYRDAVVALFTILATIRGRALRDDLYTLLGSPDFTSDQAMRQFATDVRISVSRYSDNSRRLES